MFPVKRSTFPWRRNSSQAAANNNHLQRIHQRVSKGHDLAGGIALVPRLAGLRHEIHSGYVKIAIENMAIEIVDLPIEHGDFP
jgi:hypothetical protein